METLQTTEPRSWSAKARHLWLDEGDAKRLIGPVGLQRLTQRVRQSEHQHSGEIRLCIEAALPLRHLMRGVRARTRAESLFQSLGVGRTQGRNGVLIYLLLADHAIEIVVDPVLRTRVDPVHWQGLVANMQAHFRAHHFERGLADAVDAVDTLLREHCPAQGNQHNPNELPDEPVLL
jgi:uncharacterized membrane protein